MNVLQPVTWIRRRSCWWLGHRYRLTKRSTSVYTYAVDYRCRFCGARRDEG